MSDEWRRSTLGEVAQVVGGGTPSTKVPDYWGGDIAWLTPTEVVRADGKTIGASDRTITSLGLAKSSANLLPAGAVLLTTRASVGFTALTAAPLATNQGFQSLIPRDGLHAAFLMLWIQANREEFRSRAGGSTFPEVSKVKVRQIPITIPPLEVQRRIVDLMGALGAQTDALIAEAVTAGQLQGSLLEVLANRETAGVEPRPLGAVGEFIRGRRFTKDEYVPSGLGCIHYGQIHTQLGPVTKRSLTFLPEASRSRLRLARPGDVVIAATSEDVEGLGKATAWLGDDDVAVHDDCYIFRHGLDPKFASFVFASPWFQEQKRQYAGGTKVTRISGSDLARISVPIPPIEGQVLIGEALSSLSDHLSGIRSEIDALRQLRSSMLTELLSQGLEVQESYDRLMDAGVA